MSSQENDFIPLSIPFLGGNEENYLKECVKTNFVSSIGPFVNKFESFLSKITGFKHCTAVCSGTAALQVALLANGIKKNDLVIIPSYTFIATANAVSHCGAEPWIFDISPDDWNLDLTLVRTILEKETYFDTEGSLRHKKSDRRVSALVPVFCMGMPIDMDLALALAQDFNLKLIIDAAAGLGSKYKGDKIGNFSVDAFILSFNGNKNITTGGGGAILSNNKECINISSHLSSTGRKGPDYDHDCVAFNYRMTNIQAALGVAQLENIEEMIDKKKKIFQKYQHSFKNSLVSSFPTVIYKESSYWLSGIIVGNCKIEDLIKNMNENSIEARLFWKPIHLQKPYKNCYKTMMTISDNLWRKVLVLPSSVSLSDSQQNKVCKTVKSYFEAKSEYK